MGYLGNSPAESYASFERQVFTIVNSQTAYTLNHAVTNENDIRLVVNNVVQEPGSGKAYTASGTTLTLSAALVNGTDEMYCVFLGRALQTVNPPNASVGTSQLAATSVTAAKLNNDIISGTTALASEPDDTDEFLVSDAGTLKRIDYSLIKATAPGLVKISTVTCSDTATVDFDNLSSDYNMYIIIGSQIRPATNDIDYLMNFGTDGSTYDKNKTSVYFYKHNNEGDSDANSGINGAQSLGNSTSDQQIMRNVSSHGSYGKAPQMKAYISGLGQGGNYASFDIYSNYWHTSNYAYATHISGMVQANCDCVRFKANSGNIATGKFTLFGVNQ